MKKFLFMLFFLCMTVPGTADAENFLNTEESFQIAKAVKLGRQTSSMSGEGSILAGGGKGSTAKSCDTNCKTCNTNTGVCSACKSAAYTIQNGACKTCSSLMTGCTQCSSTSVCTKCTSGYILNSSKKCERAFTLKKLNFDNSVMSTSSLPVSQLSSYYASWPDVDIYDANGGAVTSSTSTVVMRCSAGLGEYWTMAECNKRLREGYYCASSGYSCEAKQDICMRENCKSCDPEGYCAVCETGYAVDHNTNYGECVADAVSLMRYDSAGRLESSATVSHSAASGFYQNGPDYTVSDFYSGGAVTTLSQAIAVKCKQYNSPLNSMARPAFWSESQCQQNLEGSYYYCATTGGTCPYYMEDCEEKYNTGCSYCDRTACGACYDGYTLDANGTCQPSQITLKVNDGAGTYTTTMERPNNSTTAEALASQILSAHPWDVSTCTATNNSTITCTCKTWNGTGNNGKLYSTKARCNAAISNGYMCQAVYGTDGPCSYSVGSCSANCTKCTAQGTVPICSTCASGYVLNDPDSSGFRSCNSSYTLKITDAAGTYSTTTAADGKTASAKASALVSANGGSSIMACSASGSTINCQCKGPYSIYATKARCDSKIGSGHYCNPSTMNYTYCDYADFTCPTGCSACSYQNGGVKCTSCSSGYTLSNNTCVNSDWPLNITDGKGTYSTTYKDTSVSSASALATKLKSANSSTVSSCTGSNNNVNCTCQTWGSTKLYATKDRCDSTLSTGYVCVAVYGTSVLCPYTPQSCGSHCTKCTAQGTMPICSQCESGYSLSEPQSSGYRTCEKSCSAGYYNKSGTCTACTGMYYSLGGAATSCSACSTYSSAGSNTCTKCDNATGVCTGSNGGSSSGGSSGSGSSSCTSHSNCPSGYHCTGSGCQKCASGSNLALGNCNCPVGKKSNGSGACVISSSGSGGGNYQMMQAYEGYEMQQAIY